MCCITLLPGCETPSPADNTMAQAATYQAQGEYSAAEQLYQNLLITSEDADTILALVDLYIQWQRPRSGLAMLDRALAQGVSPTEVITRELTLLIQDQQWRFAHIFEAAIQAHSAARSKGRAQVIE